MFKNEIEIKNASGDGFSHLPGSFSYSLYNGSFTRTVNSNIDRRRGQRGSVIFDECGFLSEEMIDVYGAFAAVNKDLKTGRDESGKRIDPIRQRTIPMELPYQKIYISSASSTDTKFYKLYKEFMMKRIMGDPDYAILHIDCDTAFSPTLHGEKVAPLLSRSTVATAMRTNSEKARREYYCQFTTEAGADAIVKRGVLTRNEEIRRPLLYNDTGDKKFIFAYDPARSRDNSVILIMEVYEAKTEDGDTELKGKIVNVVNLMDVGKKIKSPMRTPDQIEYLKKLIIDYNAGADAYGNIEAIYIDAGSGGGGVNIGDFLMPDWTDNAGVTHRGLIDKEYYSEYVSRFPNAVDKLRLMSPTQFKSIMYEAMIELLHQDKISFTSSYDGKGYLTVFKTDEEKIKKEKAKIEAKLKKQEVPEAVFAERVQEELRKIQSVETEVVKLDWADIIALENIDCLKEELVNMVRKKRESGKDSFELTAEKANKLNDDRAYTLCMASYGLSELRRKKLINRARKPKKSIYSSFVSRAPKKIV